MAAPFKTAENWADDPVSPEDSSTNILSRLGNLSTEDDVVEPTESSKPKYQQLVKTDEENVVQVSLAQVDASESLYAGISTFEDLGLKPELLKGIYAMGFQKPSKIQEKALPLLLASPSRNMIGQSQAGTGKTAAFVLTMLSKIDFGDESTQAICLAPARELARQIMDNVREMGKYTQVTTAFAIKDSVAKGEQIKAHVVIGTPGTVTDLIKKRQLNTTKVRIFVLDEADNMLDQQGLGDQSIRVKK